MATQQDIEDLKESWKKDPIWDIEDTDGFQEHHDELLKFREDTEIDWQLEEEERIAKRARVIEIDTGVTASGAAQSIKTYAEIEHWIDHPEMQSLSIEYSISAAHVRATLLLAAQVQRVADALEQRNEIDCGNDQTDFMTKLFKVE